MNIAALLLLSIVVLMIEFTDGGDLRHPLSTMNIAALLLLSIVVLMINFAPRPVELWLYHYCIY
jgi:hypothetical protein